MKNMMKISVILCIALMPNLFFASCTDNNDAFISGDTSQNAETVQTTEQNPITQPAVSALIYEGDFSSAFTNPERGYYKRSNVTEIADFTFVINSGITIVHSYIPIYTYLDMTKDNPWGDNIPEKLPEQLLEDLQTGLDAIREAGVKVILRPAYAWDWTPPVVEHWETVQSHLAQINEIISKNADVVMGLEAGVLGPWGEWHSDGIYTDSNSQDGAAVRYEIFKYILDTTPDSIPVMLRYPYFIKEMLYMGANPPEGEAAMTQVQLDRIGYHDDSFLVNENDWGSYDPRNVWWGKLSGLSSNNVTNETFRTWMYDMRTSSGANILMGGEMEWDGDATLKHENSVTPLRVLTEMADLHTTEISTDYNPIHIDLWRNTDIPASDIGEPTETVYDRIERRLGYRFRLTEAEMTTAESARGEFKITASIINTGFAGIVRARPVYIVLDDGKNRYDIPLNDTDVRMWQPGQNTLNASFKLPADMPIGVYTAALWLPDNAENLRMRSDYSVRFANKGNVWDSKNGYNKLGEFTVIP